MRRRNSRQIRPSRHPRCASLKTIRNMPSSNSPAPVETNHISDASTRTTNRQQMNRNKTNEENEMRNKKNNMLSIILPTVALLCAGCTVERPIESLFAPGSTGTAVGKADSPGRFQDAGTGNPSAIDSAMELSAKYAKLIEEMAAIKADNQRLAGENLILKDQLAP